MEIHMIQARLHMQQKEKQTKNKTLKQKRKEIMTTEVYLNTTWFDQVGVNYTTVETLNVSTWNGSDVLNTTNVTDYALDYDYQLLNSSTATTSEDIWVSCKEWTAAQHTLFQTANFFFAVAFLVPGSFKQSVLLVRYVYIFFYNYYTQNGEKIAKHCLFYYLWPIERRRLLRLTTYQVLRIMIICSIKIESFNI